MDGFSYIDIFETKGIEYLVIIGFLLLLIPFYLVLNRRLGIRRQVGRAMGVLSARLLRIPQGVFFSRNHLWAHLETSGAARVGLDDFLLHVTGPVTVKHLKGPDDEVRKGDLIAEIRHKDKSLQLFSPISGKVMGINPALEEAPELVNEDPYRAGWLYRIKPADWKGETQSLYLAGEATDWLGYETQRIRDFLSVRAAKYTPESSMVILQDGGEVSDQALSDLPQGFWKDFQQEFLAPEK